MSETEFPRMQHLARIMFCELRSVNFVAQYWMTKMMEMDTDLMRTAAVQSAFDQTCVFARANHPILGFRGAPARWNDRHPLSMHGMAPDLFFNNAGTLPQFPSDQGEINLFDRARGELFRQTAMSLIILRDDDATARVLIEAMHNSRTLLAANSRKIWAMMQQRIHQRVFAMTGSGMNDQPSGLVDHNEIVVLKQNIERNVLRFDVDLFNRWFG